MNDWAPPPPPSPSSPSTPMSEPTPPQSTAAAVNPYAPPSARLAVETEAPDFAEAIRKDFLSHEASLRSVGTLYGIGSILFGVSTVFLLISAIGTLTVSDEPADAFGAGVLFGVVAFYAFASWSGYYLATRLRALDPRVRVLGTVLLAISLLMIPIGTLIGFYALFLVHGAKGRRVLTAEYQAIVQQTPHIRYDTPIWLIALALILGVIMVVIISMAFITG
ncbi:MAG: hypothetical protein AAGE94_15760 [Acidobacteriota bacterium]